MEVEQLLSLSGSALAQAVSSLLETPGLYVFSDILELPNVRELENGPHAPVYQLLNLFAYGTYCDYKERAASLPELTPAQRNKLRHLSIISLASNLKVHYFSSFSFNTEVQINRLFVLISIFFPQQKNREYIFFFCCFAAGFK
ncbi:COP9 signalosome complex subunit 7b [Xenotaenia resolanae]|uniref:COP9 signalosome complex subunit 7b n=1 Tax=Xenotaenia resolanae TaxID=208358 RepID=A0ABV0WNM5_9TELE